MLLETIRGPEDLKKLSRPDMETLGAEIRQELIHTVSRRTPGIQSRRGGADTGAAPGIQLSERQDRL